MHLLSVLNKNSSVLALNGALGMILVGVIVHPVPVTVVLEMAINNIGDHIGPRDAADLERW